MNVLIDFHHSDLHESLYRLFEDRLGFRVHTPRGMEWHDSRIWHFGKGYADGGLGVARQFLTGTERDELQPDRDIHWVTLEDANRMDWGLVVATVPDNYDGYARFAADHGAQFAVEVGNVNQWAPADALILDSTAQYPGGIPITPEFDLDAFHHRPPLGTRVVSSFVNLFPGLPCYSLYQETMAYLPGWHGAVFGHNGPDGFIKPTATLGAMMRASDFIWHDKVSGDGFGYVIHYAAAVGRPLIGHASHYRGQRAEYLWEDGVTCIDLDRHSPTETAAILEEIVSDPPRHRAMCEAISERVRANINWAAEAATVGDALAVPV